MDDQGRDAARARGDGQKDDPENGLSRGTSQCVLMRHPVKGIGRKSDVVGRGFVGAGFRERDRIGGVR